MTGLFDIRNAPSSTWEQHCLCCCVLL